MKLLLLEPLFRSPIERISFAHLVGALQHLHDFSYALVHREHDRLARCNARCDALVERLDTLLPPHVRCDPRYALDGRLARFRG